MILLSFIILIVLYTILKIGIRRSLPLAFFTTLAFNVEVALLGDAFDSTHTGGLRANLTLTHVYLIVVMWFFTDLLNKKNKKNTRLKAISKVNFEFVFFFLYFLTSVLSLYVAVNKIAAIYVLIRILFLVLLYYLLSRYRLKEAWPLFIAGIVFTVCTQLAIGIGQLITNDSIGLAVLGENQNPFRGGTEGLERGISGTLGHPGTFAIFLTLIFPILLTQLLTTKKQMEKYFIILSLIVGILAIFLSSARTSIVIVLVGSIFIILFNLWFRNRENLNTNRIFRFGLLFLFIVIIGASFIIDEIVSRFVASDFIFQILERNRIAQLALDIIFESPKNILLGVGLNNYTDIISSKGTGFIYSHPVHNFYLLLWAEAGIFNLVSFILILFFSIRKMLFIVRKGKLDLANKALGILISLMSLVFYNFTGWSNNHNQIFILFFTLIIFSNLIFNEFKNHDRKDVRQI